VSTPTFYPAAIMILILDRFRWAALQLDALSRCRNMGAVLQTLSSLPTTLDETYAQILRQIDEYEQPHVRRILQWVCFSSSPLEPVQLAEVHWIGGNICPPFNLHDALFQVEDIFAICPGFLIQENGQWGPQKIVQFAHFSVKEYLLSPRALSWGFTELESHISIVRASIAYFLHMVSQEKCDIAELTLVLRVLKYPLGNYVTTQCGYHLNFITPRDHSDLEESFHALLDPKSAPLLVHNLGFSFLAEALADSMRWRQWEVYYPHVEVPETLSLIVASALGLSQALRWLFSFEFLCDWVDAQVIHQWNEYGNQERVSYWPLLCASRCGHVDVVQLLIERGANVNLNHSGTALTKACQYKQLEVVKVLLEYGADAECACALWWSCHEGFEEGVWVLLDAGVNVNHDDGKNGTPLQAVVTIPQYKYGGNAPRIVQMLVDAGVEVNYMGIYARSVLEEAVYHHLKEVVQILLAAGADVKQGDRSESALQIALPREDAEMVQMLLNAGACIDETGGDLQRASHGGHVEVVQMILDAGADVNQVAGEWGTALQAASCGGHVNVVHKLLNAGANVNQMVGTYGNALTAAVFYREWVLYQYWDRSQRDRVLDIVQTLLDAGAEVNQTLSGEYGNALQAAAERGNIEVVQILLDVGADVNAYGGRWGSALQAASWSGSKEIVQLLLQAGADVNQQGGEGGNALQAAANNRKQDIVQILMDAGAHINWKHTSHREYYKFRGLHKAAKWGRADMIQLLLDAGANINQKRKVRTALEIASWCGDTKAVRLLLQAGADVNQRCGPGYGSALQSASLRGHEEIVQMLLDAGANIYQRGGQFGSALGAALSHNPHPLWKQDKDKVIQMLLDSGADLLGEVLLSQFWSLVETEGDHGVNET
jgi:ankyrin repeat protein